MWKDARRGVLALAMTLALHSSPADAEGAELQVRLLLERGIVERLSIWLFASVPFPPWRRGTVSAVPNERRWVALKMRAEAADLAARARKTREPLAAEELAAAAALLAEGAP